MYTSMISVQILNIASLLLLKALFLGFFCFIFDVDLPSFFLDFRVWLFANDLKLLISNLIFHDDLWQLYSRNIVNGVIVSSDKTKKFHFTGTAQLTITPDLLLENLNSDKNFTCVSWIWSQMESSCFNEKLHKARQSFFSLKSKTLQPPSILMLQLYHSKVLSILLYGFPAWYPDIVTLKCLESFQCSCLSWIFGRTSFYQEHPKRSQFLFISYYLLIHLSTSTT